MFWVMATLFEVGLPRTAFLRRGTDYSAWAVPFSGVPLPLPGVKRSGEGSSFPRAPRPAELPSILLPCATSERHAPHHLQIDLNLSNLVRHNHGSHNECQQVITEQTVAHAHARTRDEGRDKTPADSPATYQRYVHPHIRSHSLVHGNFPADGRFSPGRTCVR